MIIDKLETPTGVSFSLLLLPPYTIQEDPAPRGGGVLWISSDGDDRRNFLGLKFSIRGFFGVGTIWQVFFGWLDLSRDFFGYSKQSEDSW